MDEVEPRRASDTNRSEAVASDMADIFVAARPEASQRNPHVRMGVRRQSPARRRKRHSGKPRMLATFAVVTALAAGLLLTGYTLLDFGSFSLPSLPSLGLEKDAGGTASRPAEIAPADPVGSGQVSARSDDIAPRQVSQAEIKPPAAPKSALAVEDTPPRSTPPSAPVGTVPKKPSSTCAAMNPASRAWCRYPNVLAAEAKLRVAYAAATRANIDGEVLAKYQNRWSMLNRNGSADPNATMKSYRVLEQELQELISDAHRPGRKVNVESDGS